ncbi:MAG: DUF2264 domain-containing protein [Planctomycetota bacterium]
MAQVEEAVKYQISEPENAISPITGMTRVNWIETIHFLMEGVFGHIENFDDPIRLPRQHEVTYPKPDDPSHKFQAAEYEGLSRTFLAAANLINEKPSTVINGYHVRDYYANQILAATDPKSRRYLNNITELIKEFGLGKFQHVVEGAALCIGLMYSRNEIWDKYSKREKDQIAHFISDYAHNRTLGHNWRFFNVLMLTFLKINDYPINEDNLKDHMQSLMSAYVGDGWYRDDKRFDFYNPWAFHFYGPLWNSWYGYEHEPQIAEIIEHRHSEFMKSYPMFFGRNGHQQMWGRSIIYRCAASAAFGAAFLLKNTSVDPGWARRIASGNLLQFLSRDDTFYNNIPCLGYYGPYAPLVQFYSCAASPFWLAKIYVALSLPENSPFWTATENEGIWPSLGDKTETITLNGPGLTLSLDGKTGTAELRPGKVQSDKVFDLPPDYNRLAYNSTFLGEDDSPEGATAMHYCVKELGKTDNFLKPNGISFYRQIDGVLYRQLGISSKEDVEGRIDLADLVIPSGVIRIDRLRTHVKHELHLGHYGLAHIDGEDPQIATGKINGKQYITASLNNRSLALIAYHGWTDVDSMVHDNKHPEASKSTVIYAKRIQKEDYEGMTLLVTILLHKTEAAPWNEKELSPIKDVVLIPWTKTGQPCGARLTLNNGAEYLVDFAGIEGQLSY